MHLYRLCIYGHWHALDNSRSWTYTLPRFSRYKRWYEVKRRELMKGNTDSLLLGLLGQQPMYGYQIIRELENRSQGYFKYKEGTLYPALHRLEKSGMVSAYWHAAPGGRQRRYYQLTERGHARLAEQRSQWLDFLNAMNTIIRPVTI